MPIIKYTTQIDPHKTISEIEMILAKKAKAIQKIYDETGMPTGMSFMIENNGDLWNYKIPINYDAMYKILKSEDIPNRLKTKEQAIRVCWRVLKDWINSQLVIIELGQSSIEQLFFPHLMNSKGQTFFEIFKENKKLLLESSKF